MTTDLKDVLKELDNKITDVYDLNLAKEMTDIYIDLTDRVNELSSQYWKLVKALAKTEKDRDDLLMKLRAKSEQCKMTFEVESEIQEEKDQAEYDRDYYKNEVEWLRNEVEWHREEAEKERRLRVTAEYEKELAEMELSSHD